MSSRQGYDALPGVVAQDELGNTDLQEDLEFHNSNFEQNSNARNSNKIQPDHNSSLPPFGSGSSPSANGKRYLWSIHFYQQFFDIDTPQLLHRCRSAIYPRQPFLDVLEGNPDLYGPFWIATTVVVILFLTGTISQYLAEEGKAHFVYDFRLLSGAAGLVYGYTAVVPLGLWGALKWFGSESANLLECWALYGYANLIWIVVALISWSPLSILNYTFVAVGFALSAVFLFRNLYPIITAADQKASRIMLVVMLVLHAGFAIAIKFLFFDSKKGGGSGKGDGDDDKLRVLMGL